jgi:hypothetical protein
VLTPAVDVADGTFDFDYWTTVFIGQVTGAGTQTVTVSITGSAAYFVYKEFSTTAGFAGVSLRAHGSEGLESGPYAGASLSAQAGDLYFMGAYGPSQATASSGYAYLAASGAIGAWNANCGAGAQAPVFTGGVYLYTISVLLKETIPPVTGTTFAALVTTNDGNVRKGLKGGVIVGPYSSATLPTAMTSGSTPALQSLTGWTGSLGRLSDAGADFSKQITAQSTYGWGEGDPARTDISQKTNKLKFQALETNKTVLATYFGVTLSSLTADLTTGEVTLAEPVDLSTIYYRMMVLAQDGSSGAEQWLTTVLPKAAISNYGNMVFANNANVVLYDVEVTAFVDSVAGYSMWHSYSGPGWLSNKTAAGF